jgi:hypothetical protein
MSEIIAVEDKSVDWVTELVSKIEASGGYLEAFVDGQKLTATIGHDLLQFFKENKAILIRMGKQVFKDFLTLLSEKKEEEAFNLLVSSMSADEIIARINMNAAQLSAYNDTRDKFYAALKQFVMKTLMGAASKLIIGLLV